MSQEPYDPGLIKWSSKVKLDLYTFIIYRSYCPLVKPNQTKELGKCSFVYLLPHISSHLFYISSTGGTQWLVNVTMSGREIIMRSSPLLSASVTSLVQLSQPIFELPYHQRDATRLSCHLTLPRFLPC